MTFLPLHPYTTLEPVSAFMTTRDDLRTELRTEVITKYRECQLPTLSTVWQLLTTTLGRLTGIEDANLSYSEKLYAKNTVIRDGWKLCGWPKKIPFKDFNSIRGGNAALRTLLRRWRKGVLRFERATLEDIEAARRDPSAVRPGAAKKKARPPLATPAPSNNTVNISPLADDPDSPSTICEHSTLPQPAPPAALGKHQCQWQRMDMKKPRGRDLTGRYVRKNPLPKEGVKSKPFIVDSDVEDDFGQPAAEHGEFYFFDEPIPAFQPARDAEGSMFTLFACSPFKSNGRPSGTMRISDVVMGL